MRHAVWTLLAESELDDILFHIAVQDGRPATAANNYYDIRKAVDRHAEKQLPGRQLSHAPADWYFFHHKRWFIFYRCHPEGIEIMRIIDASMDLLRQFNK